MIDRPCRTDRDLRRMWQLLLPDMPLPRCGSTERDADAEACANAPAKGEDGKPRERLLGRRE